MTDSSDKIKKVSIIISKGSLDGVYPGLIMANGARMEGIEASIFFTFFGLYAILSKYMGHIGIATVGNPAMRVPAREGLPTSHYSGRPSRNVGLRDRDDEQGNGKTRYPSHSRIH